MATSAWNNRRICLYTLRVERDARVFRGGDDREPFVANFDGNGADLLTFVSAFVKALPADELVERDERHFGQPREILRRGRFICWEMDGGESGRATDIQLERGGKKRRRQRSGVEWEPFWAYVVVPNDSNVGWLMVEKSGRYSLPTEWREEMRKHFRTAYRGYRLVIGTVRETSLWAQVENAAEDGRLVSFEEAKRSKKATTGAAGYERQLDQVERRTFLATGDPLPGKALRIFRRERTITLDGTHEVTLGDDVDDISDTRYRIKLRDDIAELRAVVLNHDGQPKTVVFNGLDPLQTIEMADTASARPSRSRFVTECHSTVKDLAISSGVKLAAGWDTGKWNHPKGAPKLEVTSVDSPQTGEAEA